MSLDVSQIKIVEDRSADVQTHPALQTDTSLLSPHSLRSSTTITTTHSPVGLVGSTNVHWSSSKALRSLNDPDANTRKPSNAMFNSVSTVPDDSPQSSSRDHSGLGHRRSVNSPAATIVANYMSRGKGKQRAIPAPLEQDRDCNPVPSPYPLAFMMDPKSLDSPTGFSGLGCGGIFHGLNTNANAGLFRAALAVDSDAMEHFAEKEQELGDLAMTAMKNGKMKRRRARKRLSQKHGIIPAGRDNEKPSNATFNSVSTVHEDSPQSSSHDHSDLDHPPGVDPPTTTMAADYTSRDRGTQRVILEPLEQDYDYNPVPSSYPPFAKSLDSLTNLDETNNILHELGTNTDTGLSKAASAVDSGAVEHFAEEEQELEYLDKEAKKNGRRKGKELFQEHETNPVGGENGNVTMGQAHDRSEDKSGGIPLSSTELLHALGYTIAMFGKPNVLRTPKSKSLLQSMWIALQDKVHLLLSVAAVVAFALALHQDLGTLHPEGDSLVDWVEGVAIMVVVAIFVAIGSFNNWLEGRQLKALNEKKDVRGVKVIRNDLERVVDIKEFVVGDILNLEPGEIVPCDGIFLSGHNVQCDESGATGESDAIRHYSLTESDSSNDANLMKLIVTHLIDVFRDVQLYKKLLKYRDTKAQMILDVFQTLLDTNDLPSEFKSNLLVAMQRLSKNAGLYPASYNIQNVELESDEPVAGGSFADIYKGHFGGKVVCLKVIRLYQTSHASAFLKQFCPEAILWSQLSHPNLLPVYGLYHYGSRVCLVSPWMEYGDVTSFLSHHHDECRTFLVIDVASGIDYLHAHNIIHGDLKAVNILVDNSRRACLADFGLSGVSEANILHWTSHSSAASKGGSVRWQAPELFDFESEKVVHNSKSSDVYAFGCVAYEIYTDTVPFHEVPRDAAVMFKIQSGCRPSKPDASSHVWGPHQLTEGIWSLMESCWAENPEARPSIKDIYGMLIRGAQALDDDRPSANVDVMSPGHLRNGVDARGDFPASIEAVLSLF